MATDTTMIVDANTLRLQGGVTVLQGSLNPGGADPEVSHINVLVCVFVR